MATGRASSSCETERKEENTGVHFSTKKQLYVKTPVLLSHQLTSKAGYKVYLKLENLQPPGSFKIRGISHMIQKVKIILVAYSAYDIPKFEYLTKEKSVNFVC